MPCTHEVTGSSPVRSTSTKYPRKAGFLVCMDDFSSAIRDLDEKREWSLTLNSMRNGSARWLDVRSEKHGHQSAWIESVGTTGVIGYLLPMEAGTTRPVTIQFPISYMGLGSLLCHLHFGGRESKGVPVFPPITLGLTYQDIGGTKHERKYELTLTCLGYLTEEGTRAFRYAAFTVGVSRTA